MNGSKKARLAALPRLFLGASLAAGLPSGSCAVYDLQADEACRNAGYAIASRTAECTDDTKEANARYEAFRDAYRCTITTPLNNDFLCAASINDLTCDQVNAYGRDFDRYLAAHPFCDRILIHADGRHIGSGVAGQAGATGQGGLSGSGGAGQGGAEQGGAEQGGAEQGGAEQGGAEQGGAEQGGTAGGGGELAGEGGTAGSAGGGGAAGSSAGGDAGASAGGGQSGAGGEPSAGGAAGNGGLGGEAGTGNLGGFSGAGGDTGASAAGGSS